LADVTVGMPVYNGADTMRKSIECVLDQKGIDLRLIIGDNGSTDDSLSIARGYASKDSRISVFAMAVNVGPMVNMQRLALEADTPFFAWRADDDFSDAHYFETLLDLHDQQKGAALAIGETEVLRLADETSDITPVPSSIVTGNVADIALGERILQIYPPWFYGVWRRDALIKQHAAVVASYGQVYAHDLLVLFRFVIQDLVIGSNAARFTQVVDSGGRKHRLDGQDFFDRIRTRENAWRPFNSCMKEQLVDMGVVLDARFHSDLRLFAEKHTACSQSKFTSWQLRRLVRQLFG
jgi:glycosyltransferase involved in cell wall biosynthesis